MTSGDLVRSLLVALERGEVAGNEERWFSRGLIQVEWPSPISPTGSSRDFGELQKLHRRFERACVRREFKVTDLVASGDQVIAESLFGMGFRDGSVSVRINLALFSRLEHGLIVRQHLYLSFAP